MMTMNSTKFTIALIAIAILAVDALKVPQTAHNSATVPQLESDRPREDAPKPHILFVVLDDIGHADTGVHVESDLPTPNINKLAKNGIVFENYYTQTVCSPTRSSFMTGRFPFRIGFQHETTVLPGMSAHVPMSVKMLPEYLNKLGYESHMVGKWHLGMPSFENTPTGRGFKSHFGYFQAQIDYYTKEIGEIWNIAALSGFDFWRNREPAEDCRGDYSVPQYMQALETVLDSYDNDGRKQNKPLFVYFAHQTIHIPLESAKEEERCAKIETQTRKKYCDMMVELDDAMGDLIKTYKKRGLWDDTFLVVSTDNGGMVDYQPGEDENSYPVFPASGGVNLPLRGSKTTMFEGGVRALAFVNGGKNVFPEQSRGYRFPGLMHAVDLPALVLGRAGVENVRALDSRFDGVDMFVDLEARTDSSMRTIVPINVIHGGKKYSAIRFGNFKVVIDQERTADGWFGFDMKRELPPKHEGHVKLFDLAKDPEERHDLAKKMPEIAKRGVFLLSELGAGRMGDFMEPQALHLHLRALPQLNKGIWKPWMKKSPKIPGFRRGRVVGLEEAPYEFQQDEIVVPYPKEILDASKMDYELEDE